MNTKKIKNNEKGIALIVIIIAIIIVLALAGVAIYMVVSNKNGEDTQDNIGEKISTTESYVGYYADVDGDGTADGVIFADLAVGADATGSGVDKETGVAYWNDDSENIYGFDTVTSGLKEYYVSGTEKTSKLGTTNTIISAVKGTTGKDRFYVMALSDLKDDSNENGLYNWFNDEEENFDSSYSVDEEINDFGQGKANTIRMKTVYDAATFHKYIDDLYGLWTTDDTTASNYYKITTFDNKTYEMVSSITDSGKWFVPSKSEWSAFGDYLYTKIGMTYDTCTDYGFNSEGYWCSSLVLNTREYYENFWDNYVSDFSERGYRTSRNQLCQL